MNFIKGLIMVIYLTIAFRFLGVNNAIYLSMIVGCPFLFLALLWKQI
jgi:hypothetical protein